MFLFAKQGKNTEPGSHKNSVRNFMCDDEVRVDFSFYLSGELKCIG